MSDRRVLGFCWLLLTALLWMILADLAKFILAVPFEETGLVKKTFLGGIYLHQAIGAVAAIGASLAAWNHRQGFSFSLEAVQETRKVVWPSNKETKDHTVVVIIVSLIIAMVLWGFDQVFKRLFSIILSMGT